MGGIQAWVRGLFSEKEERRPTTSPQDPHGQPDGLRSFAEGHNDFTFALSRQLLQKPGNMFFSPFSIRTALAMTYAGARDQTAAQMSEALHLASSNETLHVAFAEIIGRLNAAGGGRYEMTVANSLWGQDGAQLQAGFIDLVARHYGGGMNVVDFRRGAEAARAKINQWVEDKTKRRIRDLMGPGSLNADTRLVLVNAVYFKGMWMLQFSKTATSNAPFYLEGGGKVRAQLMHQSDEVRYLQASGFQAVDLDYQGRDLSMLVLLPDKSDGLRDLETSLSAHMLHDCVSRMVVREVKIFLPRFKMTWGSVDLGAQLRALGMELAFTRSEANFSGINGHEPPHEESLFISAVIHKAFVEVNEEGTEAAAATSLELTMALRPLEPTPIPVFRADHPFLFAIRDRKSGAILFLGRMADPTRES